MCGIAGIVSPPHGLGAPLEAELRRLASELRHRGPDAEAVVCAGGAGLAHTRLSIIDLTPTGAQPMWCPERRYAISFNGEIYNFRALRQELEREGERFAGTSDTEVVLRLLVREGESALARLDGMFALALLDTRDQTVLLARDRTGQKPLYLAAIEGGGWAFASEPRPLLRVPGVDTGLDPQGLSRLLTFGFLPDPFALRRGFRQLGRGCCGSLAEGREFEQRRYVPDFGPLEPRRQGSPEQLCDQLEQVLSQTVGEHLVADVPVGVLLSGGVDSSVVASLAARHVDRLATFSVVHADPTYDERNAARAVAERLGSDHHEIEISDATLSDEEFDDIVDHHGGGFVDSSSLAVLRLSRAMRRHVVVALSGDGGDEVFAGYPRFAHLRYISALARLPRPLLSAGAGLLGAPRNLTARQLARALHVATLPRVRQTAALWIWFWPDEQARLLRPEWLPSDAEQSLDQLLVERGAQLEEDPVASAHWVEQRLLLPGDMLEKVDRMSMAASLEIRVPLLANAVTQFASQLPFSAKSSGTGGKRILRRLARRLVPAWVVDRPKRGFALPIEQLGGAVFEEATRFALESGESPLRALFRPEALDALAVSLRASGEGRDPEDSPFRRVSRRWLLAGLARALVRHGGR